ncbi:hypothetical protein ABW20_dc0101296 [Dactylellina cionopaga]|nr:hypothetical protein ABW20_dc0101296 [Dactylellina cionopaga]
MNTTDWKFDVSSFMVLVGENEEYRYRAMRRSVLECFAAAPIAGIQSYLHSTASLAEGTGLTYFSPSGMKSAPIRNMRLEHSINQKSLLRDGNCYIYEIPSEPLPRSYLPRLGTVLWVVFTWMALAGIFVGLILNQGLTWVGYANVFGFVGFSIFARLLDRYCMEDVEDETAVPDREDAVFILGRRNSCFVLKGTRQSVAERTGYGVRQKEGTLAKLAEYIMRVSSLVVILFIFLTIPNGTTWDQVAFIGINIVGQLNVMIGQNLRAHDYFSKLKLVRQEKTKKRTHVYGFLLREFKDGKWVEESGLLPQTDAWERFRNQVNDFEPGQKDDWELYKECISKA